MDGIKPQENTLTQEIIQYTGYNVLYDYSNYTEI